MITNEAIKAFTREILGCDCPEEVFDKIVCEDDVQIDSELTVSNKINIGDKLLIYILVLEQRNILGSALPKLIEAGREERNDRGFNRFRFVLVSENPDVIKDDANKLFEQIEKDEKIHLHIVSRNEFFQ